MSPSNDRIDRNSNKEATDNINYELRLLRNFLEHSCTKFYPIDPVRNPKEYSAERKSVGLNGKGVLWGLGAGITSFIFLRRAPVYIVRALQRGLSANGSGAGRANRSGYTFNKETVNNPFEKAGAKNNNFGDNPNALPEPKFKRRGGLFGIFGFLLDSTVSLLVAANVSWQMTDMKEIVTRLADTPLVEGRSMISERLCKDAIVTFNKEPLEFWNKSRVPNLPSTIGINTFHRFVNNCQSRASYEKDLRMQQGLSPEESVIVPSPGVPRNFATAGIPAEATTDEATGDFATDIIMDDNFFDASSDAQIEKWESFDENKK